MLFYTDVPFLTMGFSMTPVYAWGLQSSHRAWQAKKCFVTDAQWDSHE